MEVYEVGGAVRDRLLDVAYSETDWVVVGGTPQALLDQGYTQVGKDFPVFLHPETKEEYALARTERKQGHGYHGFAVYAAPDVSLEDDLLRRDLTVNAMARSETGVIIDPWGGQRDLAARVLRHVSPQFVEDPLRVLRVARFAARYADLGFEVAPETLSLMTTIVAAGELEHLAKERVWTETQRALSESDPEIYFRVLEQTGGLDRLFPAIRVTTGIDRLARVSGLTERPETRWAVLLSELPPERALQTCEVAKCPNAFRDLAVQVSRLRTRVKSAFSSPALCWELLKQLDALRRDEPFQGFCDAIAVLDGSKVEHSTLIAQLQAAREAAIAIRGGEFAQQGLTGPDLGRAVRAAQEQAIENVLAP